MNGLTLGSTTVCYPLSVSPRFTLERAMQGIAGCGLGFVELVAIPGYCAHLVPDEMDNAAIDEVKRLLQHYGLEPSAVNVAANLTEAQGVRFLGQAMRVAQALGTRTVVTHVEQTGSREGASQFMALVPTIIDLAEQYDVIVALETHGGLITTGVQSVALLKEIGSDRLKLTYDMANVPYYAGVLPQDDLAQMGDDIGRYIAHVHLKDKTNMTLRDYDFPPFGTGILDFQAVLDLLASGGYRGSASLEVELDGQPASPEVVDEALAQSYSYLQQNIRGNP